MDITTAAGDSPSIAAKQAAPLTMPVEPGREVAVDPLTAELEPWQFVGDPLAETALDAVRRAGRQHTNMWTAVRSLASEGNRACQRFVLDVESVPSWMDFDAARPGAAFAARNPLGVLVGLDGALPLSYAIDNVAPVMLRTGNLNRMVSRRVFETATLFVGAIDAEALRPGNLTWERCVRVRLMHTMVRTAILRSGNWSPSTGFAPVNALETAYGTYMFGTYRARVLADFGFQRNDEEAASFHLAWRYLARLLGAPAELTCATGEDQLILEGRMARHLYSANDGAIALTRALHEGLPQVNAGPRLPQSIHAAISRRVLRPALLPEIPANLPDDLQIPHSARDAAAANAIAISARALSKTARIPAVRRRTEHAGAHWLNSVVERGLDGNPAEYQPAATDSTKP
jgi:hypothetical protein